MRFPLGCSNIPYGFITFCSSIRFFLLSHTHNQFSLLLSFTPLFFLPFFSHFLISIPFLSLSYFTLFRYLTLLIYTNIVITNYFSHHSQITHLFVCIFHYNLSRATSLVSHSHSIQAFIFLLPPSYHYHPALL